MGKINITKKQLDRIIKEEALKFKKALTLKKELSNIQKQLNEVEAGAMEKSKGLPYEGGQAKPKFHNPAKNPHTMMEDGAEDIQDVDTDVDGNEDGETINKADVLKAIEDLKMALDLHGAPAEETSDEEETDEVPADDNDEDETNNPDEEEGDEIFEFEEEQAAAPKADGAKTECDMSENLEEPIEGKSVVQNAEEDDVNANMEKATNVKASGETLMEAERKRMAVLAGIMKG